MGERAFEWVSKEDYFSLVEKSDIKYEYWDGYIVDMSGGSPAHAAITAYTGVAIGSRLFGARKQVYTFLL